MLERFTDRACRAADAATAHARRLGHASVIPEHLLLALTDEPDSGAAAVLSALRVSADRLRFEITTSLPEGSVSPEEPVVGPQLRHVYEIATSESLQLGAADVGTEHLLLGLIRERTSVAAHVLTGCGATLVGARAQILETTSRSVPPPRRPGGLRRRIFFDLLDAGDQMRAATLDALVAAWEGDDDRLVEHLTEVVRMASLAGDSGQLEQLAVIVELDAVIAAGSNESRVDQALASGLRIRPRPDPQRPA